MATQRETLITEGLSPNNLLAVLKWAANGGVRQVVDVNLNEGNAYTTATKFSHGQSNPTYLITVHRRTDRIPQFKFVLRSQPQGRLLAGAHRVDREYKVLSALWKSAVPVPEVYGFCSDLSVVGTMFYAMEYLEGRIFKDLSLKEVPGVLEKTEIFKNALRVLIAISHVDPVRVGLSDLTRSTTPWIDRQITTWYNQYKASRVPGEDYSGMEELYQTLLTARRREKSAVRESSSRNLSRQLVHGDFRLDNLVFHPTRPVCIGVIDWELVSLGDPQADLATFLIPFHMPREAARIKLLQATVMPYPIPAGIPHESFFIQAFAAQSGLTEEQFQTNFRVYLAVALFRFAGILYGVQSRALEGNASSNIGGDIGKLACLFTEAGAKIMMESNDKVGVRMSTSPSSSLQEKVWLFMKAEVLPAEDDYIKHVESDLRWFPWPVMNVLKFKAKSSKLWNLFLPPDLGGTLSSAEYEPLAEAMGRCVFGAEVFNCSAPDTGKLELWFKGVYWSSRSTLANASIMTCRKYGAFGSLWHTPAKEKVVRALTGW